MNDSAQLLDLSGETAIVPGASHGLGVTFAQALTGAGPNSCCRRAVRIRSRR
jgi:NAD(P)-dependent dehydrogenase (short-subunit alcohol dehydrogenase family)